MILEMVSYKYCRHIHSHTWPLIMYAKLERRTEEKISSSMLYVVVAHNPALSCTTSYEN